MRILIVDDDAVGRKTMRYILSEFGDCVLTENAEETLAEFKKAWNDWRPYTLITLDIELPDMNGMDLLSKIRGLEEDKSIPENERVKIIMVSSYSDRDHVVGCFKAGCNEFAVKPTDKEMIVTKLSNMGFL